MTDAGPIELTEDRIPLDGIEGTLHELVDLYGGEITTVKERELAFTLPVRRGVSSSGAVACSLSWTGEGVVRLHCSRNVDAPRFQRVLLLIAGVVGAVMFMLWPFFPNEKAYGTLAWLGGGLAIAVYLLTLRKTSGGLAYDFLQRLAARQRHLAAER